MASATECDDLPKGVTLPAAGGVIVCDERGEIVFASEGIESSLGYDPEELECSRVETLFPEPEPDLMGQLREAAGEGDADVSVESLVDGDGDRRPVALAVETTGLEGSSHLTLSVQPIGGTELTGAETTAAPLTSLLAAAFGHAEIPLAVLDQDLRFVAANGSAVETYGYDSQSALVGDRLDSLFETTDRSRIRTEVLPCVRHQGRWCGDVRTCGPDGAAVWQHISIASMDVGGYVLVGSEPASDDGTARATLELLETTGTLTRTTETAELTRHALDALVQTLGYEVGCIRLFDADSGTLEPTALTGRAEQLVASRPAFDLDATSAGQAYRQGELVTGICDGLVEEVGATEERTLHAPIGDQGTVTLLSADGGEFSPGERELVDAFATALAAHVSSVRRRTERRDRLDHLETTAAFTRDVVETLTAIVDETAPAMLAETVCDRLAASEYVDGVWFAENALAEDGVTVRAWSGIDAPYVNLIETLTESGVGCDTLQQTIDRGTVTMADDSIDLSRDDASRVALVPVVVRTHVHGIFGIHLSVPAATEPELEPVLAAIGETFGFALQTARARALLRADRVVELEFDISAADSLLVDVATALDCRFELERGMLVDEATDTGDVRCYVRVDGASVATALEAFLDRSAIRDASVARATDDGGLVEIVRTDGGPLVQLLRDAGTTVQSVTATAESGRFVVQAPQSADVRRLVSTYQAQYPGLALVAKRERDRDTVWPASQWDALEERLTEKQQLALETAVAEGYYEWPRESTAEEVAESMGISSATLHQHLRRGEQELLSSFLDNIE